MVNTRIWWSALRSTPHWTSYLVLGDHQRLPGYCVLLYDGKADQLIDLEADQASAFMRDVWVAGRALANVCQQLDPQFRRVNYEILGNTYRHLHAHLHCRYEWEEEPLRSVRYGYTQTCSTNSLKPTNDSNLCASAYEPIFLKRPRPEMQAPRRWLLPTE